MTQKMEIEFQDAESAVFAMRGALSPSQMLLVAKWLDIMGQEGVKQQLAASLQRGLVVPRNGGVPGV